MGASLPLESTLPACPACWQAFIYSVRENAPDWALEDANYDAYLDEKLAEQGAKIINYRKYADNVVHFDTEEQLVIFKLRWG